MAAELSTKAKAWLLFDRIVADAAPEGIHSNPWIVNDRGDTQYAPDLETLRKLLGVPLHFKASTTTGVPALALDVWLSYELRRAGFDPDAVWPRGQDPRVLPAPIVNLLAKLPQKERELVWRRVQKSPSGVASGTANILGKNYRKQVDVGMSTWESGPQALISTKRMDSSFGKNAANRVEESYGDAKNLRLRHPLAALGFVYGLRSTILEESPDTADWIIDLLQKLGHEDDAYHAVALIMIEYGADFAVDNSEDDPGGGEDRLIEAGLKPEPDETDLAAEAEVDISELDTALATLPAVRLLQDRVPDDLQPGHFLDLMVRRIISATPVNMHIEARKRLREAADIARSNW